MQSRITYEIAGEGRSILAIVAFAMHPGRVNRWSCAVSTSTADAALHRAGGVRKPARGAVTPAQNPPA
jgi:hypothetical protein